MGRSILFQQLSLVTDNLAHEIQFFILLIYYNSDTHRT
jgi:hypothetical protein